MMSHHPGLFAKLGIRLYAIQLESDSVFQLHKDQAFRIEKSLGSL